MIFRAFSGLCCVLCIWSAYLQLNDPDPARWVAMYLSGAAVAVMAALGRVPAWLPVAVGGISLAWALAILPEIVGRWHTDDLMATMIPERPEIEFGREFFGLMIVFAYCLTTWWVTRRAGARPS